MQCRSWLDTYHAIPIRAISNDTNFIIVLQATRFVKQIEARRSALSSRTRAPEVASAVRVIIVLRDGLGGTHDEPSMLNALGADEAVGQLLDIFRLTAEYDDFEAILVVEMGMQSGNHNGVTVVLKIGKLLRQQPSVMIIDEGHRTHHQRVTGDHHGTNESVAN